MRNTFASIALSLLLATSASAGCDWRAPNASTFETYCDASLARVQRLGDVLTWKLGSSSIVWRITLQSWIKTGITDLGSGQGEVVWRMDKTVAAAMVKAYLEANGVDTSGMTVGQIADAWVPLWRDEILAWEADYNAHLAKDAAPVPDPVDPL